MNSNDQILVYEGKGDVEGAENLKEHLGSGAPGFYFILNVLAMHLQGATNSSLALVQIWKPPMIAENLGWFLLLKGESSHPHYKVLF